MDKQRLHLLKKEKQDLITAVYGLDKRLQNNSMTRYERDFLVNSLTRNLGEREYLSMLNIEIASLENSRKENHTFKDSRSIAISGALVALSVIVVFLFMNPSLTGFISFSNEKELVMQINQTINSSSNAAIPIRTDSSLGNLTSLRVTGAYTGTFRIYLIKNISYYDDVRNVSVEKIEKYLVYDAKDDANSINSMTGLEILGSGNPDAASSDNSTEAIGADVNDTDGVPANVSVNNPVASDNTTVIDANNPVEAIPENILQNITENLSENITSDETNIVETNVTQLNISQLNITQSNISENNQSENISTENISINAEKNNSSNISSNISEGSSNISEGSSNISEITSSISNESSNNSSGNPIIIQENITENSAAGIAENVSENMTEEISKNMTQNISENITENISENILNATINNNNGFIDKCIDTCMLDLEPSGIYLLAEVDANSTLTIDTAAITQKIINHAPVLLKNFSDIYLNSNETASINLTEYFSDIDNDTLMFDTSSADWLNASILHGILTLSTLNDSKLNASMFVYATDGKEIITSNTFTVIMNQNIINASPEEIVQYQARLGEPVRWVKKIKLAKSVDNYSVDIPSDAMNVSVSKIVNNKKINVAKNYLDYQARQNLGSLGKQNLKNITKQNVKNPVPGNAAPENAQIPMQEIIINTSIKDAEVEYYTQAPYAIENNFSNSSKEVIIASDDHYINISSFTDLPREVLNKDDITFRWKIYDYQNLTGLNLTEKELEKINSNGYILKDIDFTAIDTDGNGLLDRIEWITPHLSNQTYEINITILNVHSNPSLYGNWTVDFTTAGIANLTITASIDMNYYNSSTRWTDYSENSSLYDLRLIGLRCGNTTLNYSWIGSDCANNDCSAFIQDFECNDTAHEISKVLTAKKHVLKFDFGGEQAFAYNAVVPSISFVSPTLPNATTMTNASMVINISINSSNMSTLRYNWNGTDYKLYSADLVLFFNFNNISAIGDTARNFTDLSPRNKSGICASPACPLYIPGKFGNAVYFNASKKQFINITSTTSTATYTIATWIYPNMTTVGDGYQDIAYGGAGVQFSYVSNDGANTDHLSLYSSSPSFEIYSDNTMSRNAWHFVVLSCSAGTFTFYIDGVSNGGSSSAPATVWQRLGGDTGSFTEDFDGYMDEYRIYNRSLTAAEVSHLYNSYLYKYAYDGWNLEINQTNLTNGTYTYYANVTDSGNTNQTDLRYLTRGAAAVNNPPVVVLDTPTNNSIVTNINQTYKCNITDDTAINNLTLYIWNSTGTLLLTNTTVLGGVSNSTTWNYTFLYNGTFYWNCRGNDTAGNSNLSTKGNFTIIYNASYVVPDTTLPGIYFISPTPANNTAQAANSVVVNISINESNLKNFTWDWNGTNYSIYDSALVLMFNFDNVSVLGEGSNNVTDDQSIYGNNGACINMSNNCNYTSGKYGNAILFDGVKQVVNATVTQSKNSTVFWFKNSTAGSWTHVVNSSGTYYVNGTVSAVPSQYPIVINGNTVNIGMMGVGYFNGSIDEVRIYNRSLSASEALEQYYSNLNKYAIDGWLFITNQSNLTNGTYSYYGFANDTSGNSNSTGTYNISTGVQDTVSPTITLASPSNASTSNVALTAFSCSLTDNVQIKNLTLYVWNSTSSLIWLNSTNLGGTSNSTTWNNIFIYNNTVKWNCLGFDTSGNSNWSTQGNYTYTYNSSYLSTINLNFVSPTPANGTRSQTNKYAMNVTINTTTLSNYSWNWNGTNYTIYDKSLVLMMNFDNVSALQESSTRFADVSSYSNNITCSGGACPTINSSGKYGGYLSFDGSSNYLQASNVHVFPYGIMNRTICMWAYTRSISTSAVLFAMTDGSTSEGSFALMMWPTGLAVDFWADSTPYTDAIVNNTWYYICALVENKNVSIYRNGTKILSSDESQISTIPTYFYIGTYTNGYAPWNGGIDEVRVWNRTLTAAEIAMLYNSNLNKYATDGWQFVTNISGLVNGTYTYYGFAKDNGSNYASTDLRYYIVGYTYPNVTYSPPTPANQTSTTNTSVIINISINESNLNNFTWDWNGTNYSIYDSALVLMFNFDNVSVLGEGSNNVTDDQSIYGNNGACINMSNNCNYTSGKYGNAIIFDGVKQVVNATVTQSKNSTVFWFKNSTAGSWTHVVNSSGTYYVNGIVSAVPSQYPIVINGNVVNIGMMGTGYFNGSIDEVRIYNRSLSASEALEQYYSNLNKYAIDGWLFITNQSNLTIGTYTYYGYANNTGSLSNTIDTRALYITNPQMAFVSPTPANNAAINMTYAIINISFNESNLKNFTFTWNNSNYSIYDSALVLMFNFDNVSVLGEGSNNVTDDQSIYGNNGACINMSNNCNYTSGKYGNAIIFDGVKQVVNATVTQSKNSTVFWFKNSTAGSWTHVVNSSGTYYVNGTVSAVPSQYPIVMNGNTVNIGMMGTGYFNGTIDEVRIYNRSLTAAEALEQYYSNLNKYSNEYWQFFINQSSLTNGTYTYYAYALDNQSYANTTETRTLIIDTVLPNVTINSPSNGTWEFANFSLNYSATDNNIGACTLYIRDGSGGSWNSKGTVSCGSNLTTNISLGSSLMCVQQGYNQCGVRIYAADNASNVNFAESNFSIDYNGPSVPTSLNISVPIYAAYVMNASAGGSTSAANLSITYYYEFYNINNSKILQNYSTTNSYTLAGTDAHDVLRVRSKAGDGYFNSSYIENTTNISNSAPVIIYGKITPATTALSNQTLVGYCNATDADLDNVSYYYSWYLNATVYSSGSTSSNYNQSLEINVANISASVLVVAQNWTLACLATDNTANSSWINSSNTTITNFLPISFVGITPGNNTNSSNSSSIINISISPLSQLSNFTWNWNGTNYVIYDSSLVLMYNLDNVSALGEGNNILVYDASLGMNNATCYSNSGFTMNCNWTSGYYGNGLTFNEPHQYAISSNNVNVPNSFSVEAWVKFRNLNSASAFTGVVSPGWFDDEGSSEWTLSLGEGGNNNCFQFGTEIAKSSEIRLCNASIYPALNTWYYMVGTYDGSKLKLYINGTLINNATDTGFSATPKPIYVGYISSLGTNVGMNGSVDEVRIYNRALSAAEIRQQYYSNLNKLSNNSWQFYINESCLVYGNYTYYGYANDAQGNYNQTDTRKLNIMPQAPTIVSSRIYTTPTAYTNDTLYGYCNATDVQNFAITYYYQWFLNNVFNRSGSVGAFSQGQEVNVANISSNNLTAGQNWTLSCMANNSYYNSSWLNSSTPTNIVSGIPTNVSLSYPVNANSSVHQRTPVFIWGNSTPNVLWYEINFTSNHCPNFNYSSISAPKTNYTPTSELCLANDNEGNSFYNWTVRACNNVGCSAWSTSFNFSLESWVVLTMVNNSVNFGTAILGQVLNTNSGNPAPFVVENDGNVAADLINISGNQSLWVASGAQLGTRYLQMKVRNSSLQGSFNYSGSITNWTNVTASNQSVVKQLDYNTSRNQAYIDIQIEVPGAEPPGTKQTNLILNFAQSP